MGFSALLLAAAAVKIAIPAFEAERAPSVLILHGPEYYANAFDSLDCATGITVSKLGPVAHTLFTNCDGEPVCLSGIGKNIAVDFLLVGSVVKKEDLYTTDLKLVDVREQVSVPIQRHADRGVTHSSLYRLRVRPGRDGERHRRVAHVVHPGGADEGDRPDDAAATRVPLAVSVL